MSESRGQLVLVAAAVVAVALVPISFAYLQLGYHADVAAANGYSSPGANAERVLSRAVHVAADDIPARYDWNERREAIDEVRERLAPSVQTLRTARLEDGTTYAVTYNQSAAADWARKNCPGGANRQFGGCQAQRGIVVQNRVDETHVLAVGLDVQITAPRTSVRLTVLVRPVGGVER